MSTLNINNTDNQVTAVNANQGIIVIDNSNQSSINVTQPVTSVVLVNTLGPQGLQGPSGSGGNIDTSSFVTTSSFNAFTSSYSTGSFTGSFTGSLFGTSSWANQSLTSSFLIPGTYLVTSSWAQSSSQAITASYATQFRSGAIGAGGFSGTPLTSSFITLSPPFTSTAYSVVITGTTDARNWTILNKSATGFRINSNSSTAITGNVMWIAMFQTQ